MAKFEVYKDKKGETRFRYRANNGEIMFSSEGYKARASAMKAIESIKKNAPDAPVEEQAAAAPKAKSAVKKAAGKAASTIKGAAAAVAAPIAKAVSKTTAKAKAAPKAKAAAKPKAAAKAKAPAKAKSSKAKATA